MSTEHSPRMDHILRAMAETPWAILPSTLDAIRELVAVRAAGHRFTTEEIQERIGAARPTFAAQPAGAVAVIPIYGTIVPKGNMMTQISGGTSLQMIQSALRDAGNDPGISAIVLDVDSPGGSVDLVAETAAMIRDVAASKRVVAVANTTAASAAYWLATQASELVVTPSGSVGSVGVLCAHSDYSAMEERVGVKTTLIHAGRYKVEANPYEPLSDDAREMLQTAVDDYYEMFTADVAAGRGATQAAVKGGYGQGRMVRAHQAVRDGMADRVATLDQTISELLDGSSKSGRTRADAHVPQLEAAAQDADTDVLDDILATLAETTTSLKEAPSE